MQVLGKTIVQILGLFFSVLVLSFTGYQTYSLLLEVSGNPMIAALGLALFEGGMLYWLATFKNDAEGIMQMAISLLLFVFGLFLVGGATALHLGAMDAATLGQNTPSKLITIAAIVNLLGKTIYPIFAPETFHHVWTRALEGIVMAKAYTAAQLKTDDLAQNLADNVGNEMVRKLTVTILTGQHLQHNAAQSDVYALPAQTNIIDANPGEASPELSNPGKGEQSWWNDFLDWILDRKQSATPEAPAAPTTTPEEDEDKQEPDLPIRFKILLIDPDINATIERIFTESVIEVRDLLKKYAHLHRALYEYDDEQEKYLLKSTHEATAAVPVTTEQDSPLVVPAQ